MSEHKATILIVDDESSNIDLLQATLKADYKIKAAINGLKGLEIAKGKHKPDLILLDLKMPGLSGHDVCFELKQDPKTKDIPVIFITASDELRDEAIGLKLGAVDYIIKPFNPLIVKTRIKNHLELQHSRQQLKVALQKTLLGSVRMLTDMLSLANPNAFTRSQRLKKLMRELCKTLEIKDAWRFEVAANLSQVGCSQLPSNILNKYNKGIELSLEDKAIFKAHPKQTASMISHIPHLESCSKMISQLVLLGHADHVVKSSKTSDVLLQVIISYDELKTQGETTSQALTKLSSYCPDIIIQAIADVEEKLRQQSRPVAISELREGMIVVSAIYTSDDVILIPQDTPLTNALIKRLNQNWRKWIGDQLFIIDPAD